MEISGGDEGITTKIIGDIHLDKNGGSYDKELLNFHLVTN